MEKRGEKQFKKKLIKQFKKILRKQLNNESTYGTILGICVL